MTAKCEAALEEVAAQAQPYFVPTGKKPEARRVPEGPRTPPTASPQKPPAEQPASPPPKDDDFLSRYANFDEDSVAPTIPESVPVAVPTRPVRADSEKIKAAEACVPAALRNYLADQFQTRFSRLVPAEEVRIFSAHGEIGNTAEAPDTPQEDADESSAVD